MSNGENSFGSMRDWTIIVNPASSGGKTKSTWPSTFEQLCAIAAQMGYEHPTEARVLESMGMGSATDLTRKVLREGAKVVVAVGGDGTLSEVMEGFFEPDTDEMINEEAVIGYLQSGTGSDFRRTLGWQNQDLQEWIVRLLRRQTKKLDICGSCFTGTDGTIKKRHFINMSSCGVSASIAKLANEKYKMFGPNLTYIMASFGGFMQFSPFKVRIKVDDKDWIEHEEVTFITICNGKFFGGGMKICPPADPFDGYIHLVVYKGVDFLTFLISLPKLLGGEGILDSNSIFVEKVKTCDIQVEEKDKGKVNMELDGESIAVLPAQFHILPERMHMIM